MNSPRRIAVLTGSRAEFGLLFPVMRAIQGHPSLELVTIVTGAHLLPPARTVDDVATEFTIDCTFEMQEPGNVGRIHDAQAVSRGIAALAHHLPLLNPDVLLLLGDRIEPFAAAATCAVAGIRIAHMHGGDRAEGVADESMRHAISKLAHIHLPATEQSAERLQRMGENPATIHIVGSPAIDGLVDISPMEDAEYTKLGRPEVLVLMHPTGRSDDIEFADAQIIIQRAAKAGCVLMLEPNHDAGRNGIMRALDGAGYPRVPHLPRVKFVAVLKRVRAVIGNSSAGLIEAAALGVPAVSIGSRQNGREKPASVIDVETCRSENIDAAIRCALEMNAQQMSHPYGDGKTGPRTAEILATFDPAAHPITKFNTY